MDVYATSMRCVPGCCGRETGTTEGGSEPVSDRAAAVQINRRAPAVACCCSDRVRHLAFGIVRLGQKREEECNLHLNVGQDTAQGADWGVVIWVCRTLQGFVGLVR